MVRPRICVVITAPDIEHAVLAIKRVLHSEPDLIEIRFDYMEKFREIRRLKEVTDLPLIATNRHQEQGGLWKGSELDRLQVLVSACEVGFEYVDLELSTESIRKYGKELKDLGAKLVLSHHDFSATPENNELYGIMQKQLDAGADICKIVGTARDHRDGLKYLKFILDNPNVNLVSFGMGEAGMLSRIFSPVFGGIFTYASTEPGEENAPGQLSIEELKSIYRIVGM